MKGTPGQGAAIGDGFYCPSYGTYSPPPYDDRHFSGGPRSHVIIGCACKRGDKPIIPDCFQGVPYGRAAIRTGHLQRFYDYIYTVVAKPVKQCGLNSSVRTKRGLPSEASLLVKNFVDNRGYHITR